jgi:O-antigen/teichoic acid export membrane protein
MTVPSAVPHRGDARHAARSGAVQLLTIVAQGVLGAAQVVFARLFGPQIYGWYLSAVAVTELVSRGGAAGADKAMLRYVAAARAGGQPAEVRSAIASGLRLNLAVGGTLAVVLALAASPVAAALHQPALAPALRILAPLPVLLGAMWILMQATLAARVTRANFIVRGLAEPSLLLAAGVTAAMLGGGLRALAAAHLTACAATLALAIVMALRVFRRAEVTRLWAAPGRRGFARFSLPLAAAEMLNVVVQRGDIMVLTALRGPRDAALYGAAEVVSRPVLGIRSAFDSIVAGVLAETLHLGNAARLRYNLRLVTRWVVSVAAPLAITTVVLRHELLVLLFGSSYAAGAAALAVLALNQLFSALMGLAGSVLMVGGHSRLGLIDHLVAAPFNLVVAYLFISRFGIVGAACATATTMLLLQGVIVVQAFRLHRVHPFSAALLKPFAAAAACFATEAALRASIDSLWLRLPAVMGAGAVVYCLSLWALGLPEEERQIAARLFRRGR